MIIPSQPQGIPFFFFLLSSNLVEMALMVFHGVFLHLFSYNSSSTQHNLVPKTPSHDNYMNKYINFSSLFVRQFGRTMSIGIKGFL